MEKELKKEITYWSCIICANIWAMSSEEGSTILGILWLMVAFATLIYSSTLTQDNK